MDFKGRSFSFKKEFKEEKNKEKNYMEKFQYVNLKYKNIVELSDKMIRANNTTVNENN